MKVYKFGGASVKDAAGVKNLLRILLNEPDDVLVVVSAMGKTTNKLEAYCRALLDGNREEAEQIWYEMCQYHQQILNDLQLPCPDTICQELTFDINRNINPDEYYDQLVSLGELLSTRIVTAYLRQQGLQPTLWYIPDLLRTDDTWREANVDMVESAKRVREAYQSLPSRRLVITQGFIAGTANNRRTTLGREGSDYTAALMGNFLDAESVTIWKDVPGILNADPRLVSNTIKIDSLSYNDAVELAYSGAQVIHPKTIRPLANKQIPLYVRPFADPSAPGSIIHATSAPVQVPVYIWRRNQVLITMRAKDFGFVLEESLSEIFQIIQSNRLKVSLIQSSAVTVSVCVDRSNYLPQAIAELQAHFLVSWNENLSLLTIRGTTPQILAQEQAGRNILLKQTTRRTARLVIQQNT